MENNFDNSIDLEAIGKMVNQQDEYLGVETKVVGNDWMRKEVVVSTDDVEPIETVDTATDIASKQKEVTEPEKVYDGPGLVFEENEFKEGSTEDTNVYMGISKETSSNIESYLNEMDETIAEFKEKEEEESNETDSDEEDKDDSVDREDFIEEYEKAVVIIDKTNFGTVINFTDEEREKLEKSKKIKLEEVETVDLSTIKVKKRKKKDDFNKIINRVTNITTTNVVLPASGYTAAIKGCSAYELISLIEENKNALINAQNKWSLIYNKLDSTSLGKMTFDEFLHNTASVDYNTFIYGLLCSTYPDDDKLPITCTKCHKEFDHSYSTRSLIRVEKMDEELQDTIMKIVDNSISEVDAKRVHNEAPVSMIKKIKLPVSGIIADVYVQSAYDLINKSIKELQENKDSKYNNTAVMSTFIKSFYIPDEDEPGTYFEIDNANEISQTLYSLSDMDVLVIRKVSDNLTEHVTVEYGLMDITCPHCKHYTPTLDLELENILFYRYRQILSTNIE